MDAARSLRFLQFSDTHLDSALGGGRLALPAAKRRRLNREMEAGFQQACDLARRLAVDCVLVPGDVWDDEAVSFETASLVYEAFAALAPVPVILAPGNHDPLNATSYHNPRYFEAKVGRPHPSNVFLFQTPNFSRLQIPALPGVDFYGCCFTENRPRTERLLAGLRPLQAPAQALPVLLLHGSLDDKLGAGLGAGQLMTAPFSSEELLRCGFAYAALGHYHRHQVITDAGTGAIRAAYSGIPVGRGLDEAGEAYCLVGEVHADGVAPELLQRHRVSPRAIHRLQVPIDSTVTTSHAARELLSEVLRRLGIGPADMAYVELTGRVNPEVQGFDFDPAWRDSLCFHLAIDQSALEPEYNLDALLADETADKRIEGRFVQRMRELLSEADRAGAPAARKRALRLALLHGLDALHGRAITMRALADE